jgi:hypothetical protein
MGITPNHFRVVIVNPFLIVAVMESPLDDVIASLNAFVTPNVNR